MVRRFLVKDFNKEERKRGRNKENRKKRKKKGNERKVLFSLLVFKN